jgi:hypothetical protein
MYHTRLALIFILIGILLSFKAQSQSYAFYDSLSYKQYLNQDLQALRKTVREAKRADIDYYYLRMRLGILAFENKHYREAFKHFQQAQNHNTNDLILEYLYYSALWSGDAVKARETASQMSASLQEKIGFKNHQVFNIFANMAYQNNPTNVVDPIQFPTGIDGYQLIPQKFINGSVGLSHKMGKSGTLSHVVSYLNKLNHKYTFTQGAPSYETDYYVQQWQYYANGFFRLNNHWRLNLSGHVLHVSYPVYLKQDQIPGRPSTIKSSQQYWDLVGSASIQHHSTYFTMDGEFMFMELNNKKAVQPAFHLSIFPIANYNLYFGSMVGINSDASNTHFFHQHKIGFKTSSKLWTELHYLNGHQSGFALANGYLVFNGTEQVNQILGGDLHIIASNRLKLILSYQARKLSNFFTPFDETSIKSNKLEFNYSLYSILLSWSI